MPASVRRLRGGPDDLGQGVELRLGRTVPSGRLRPRSRHQQTLGRCGVGSGQRCPDLLGDERHDRMEESEGAGQDLGPGAHHVVHRGRGGRRVAQLDLGHLEVPVAQVAPREIGHHPRVAAQVVSVQPAGRSAVVAARRQRIQRSASVGAPPVDCGLASPAGRDEDEAGRVPQLVREVAGPIQLGHGQPLVDSRPRSPPSGPGARHRRRSRRSARPDRSRCPWSCSSSRRPGRAPGHGGRRCGTARRRSGRGPASSSGPPRRTGCRRRSP